MYYTFFVTYIAIYLLFRYCLLQITAIFSSSIGDIFCRFGVAAKLIDLLPYCLAPRISSVTGMGLNAAQRQPFAKGSM